MQDEEGFTVQVTEFSKNGEHYKKLSDLEWFAERMDITVALK